MSDLAKSDRSAVVSGLTLKDWKIQYRVVGTGSVTNYIEILSLSNSECSQEDG